LSFNNIKPLPSCILIFGTKLFIIKKRIKIIIEKNIFLLLKFNFEKKIIGIQNNITEKSRGFSTGIPIDMNINKKIVVFINNTFNFKSIIEV